ncbi:hypothetical protein GGR58DRAFT_512381 [Xylaria digitata]|nr:hypothetical protein GGR58DRAFT_512381 [Xylaria digitata]
MANYLHPMLHSLRSTRSGLFLSQGNKDVRTFDVVGGIIPTSPSKLETNDGSSNAEIEPRTPERKRLRATEHHLGFYTPDATLESIRIASNNHQRQGSVHVDARQDVPPQTPLISSTASLIAEISCGQRRFSQDSIHSGVEESVFERLSAFINMATQRNSRANSARVEDTISLIKSASSIRRTSVTNLRRKLTAHQYGELLRAIQNSDDAKLQADFEEKLRQLRESAGDKISDAAKSVLGRGHANVRFPFATGEDDTNKNLQKKAEMYMRRSGGEVRAVVGVEMVKLYRAEKKNEGRLKKMYMEGQDRDETESYSYEEDERNETGEASILTWRPEVLRRGSVVVRCVQKCKAGSTSLR